MKPHAMLLLVALTGVTTAPAIAVEQTWRAGLTPARRSRARPPRS